MKKKIRIKWNNILKLAVTVIGGTIIIRDGIMLATSLLSFTWFGLITEIALWLLVGNCLNDIVEEWVKTYE